MRLAKTLAALLLLANLSFSCTVDPIEEDDSTIQIEKIEDVLSTGGEGYDPPDDDKGNG